MLKFVAIVMMSVAMANAQTSTKQCRGKQNLFEIFLRIHEGQEDHSKCQLIFYLLE